MVDKKYDQSQQAMKSKKYMSWESRRYHFYIIFADTKPGEEPWQHDVWEMYLRPTFDEILRLSNHYNKTGLGSIQYAPDSDSNYYDEVKFGKLRWNEASDLKWTFSQNETTRLFAHLDCWAPMRSVCAKIDQPPDFYFSIGNERNLGEAKLSFDLFIVVAIAEDLSFDGKQHLKKLSKYLNAKKTVYRVRSWGSDANNGEAWEFINSIQDTTSFGIYKKGTTLNIHDNAFEDLLFEPYWEICYEKDPTSNSTTLEIISVAKTHLEEKKINYLRLGAIRFTRADDPRNEYKEAYWTVPYEYKVFEEEVAFIYIHDETRQVMIVLTKHGIPYAQGKWVKR